MNSPVAFPSWRSCLTWLHPYWCSKTVTTGSFSLLRLTRYKWAAVSVAWRHALMKPAWSWGSLLAALGPLHHAAQAQLFGFVVGFCWPLLAPLVFLPSSCVRSTLTRGVVAIARSRFSQHIWWNLGRFFYNISCFSRGNLNQPFWAWLSRM